ncbi:Hypothetical predicted protein [Pelobates cultripes]|uniref:Uncharacterized protein n=1 Tax=Pelobates cultripes TaxID=61616 RepID=A0AAD1S2V2_PELCU|nr:Hypothetical predicted protein [Pelobates cultripes]
MADTTCADNASDSSHDIVKRIQSHFDAFWRVSCFKLLHHCLQLLQNAHYSPTPIKRTDSRPAPTTTRARHQCKPAVPSRRRHTAQRPHAPKSHRQTSHQPQSYSPTQRRPDGPRLVTGLCYSMADKAQASGRHGSWRCTDMGTTQSFTHRFPSLGPLSS